MSPLSIEMRGPRSADPVFSVILTRSMVPLETLPHISASEFSEAACRALRNRPPTPRDVLYLYSDGGELGRLITQPLQLTSRPPEVDLKRDYGRDSQLFPLITFLFSGGGVWNMPEEYAYGRLPLREMALATLVKTPWPLKFIPWNGSRRHVLPPGFTEREDSPPRSQERKSSFSPVSDFLSSPSSPSSPSEKRIVAITKPRAPSYSLKKIPLEIFNRAVVWALGWEAREGDRLVFTAGPGFLKGYRICESLILSDRLPTTHNTLTQPQVWIERRNGLWKVLLRRMEGTGSEVMLRTILGIEAWRVSL